MSKNKYWINSQGNLKTESGIFLDSRIVLTRNVKTGEDLEYPSAKACADALGILTTTLNYYLKYKGQKIFNNGLMFKYKPLPFKEIDSQLNLLYSAAPDFSNEIQ